MLLRKSKQASKKKRKAKNIKRLFWDMNYIKVFSYWRRQQFSPQIFIYSLGSETCFFVRFFFLGIACLKYTSKDKTSITSSTSYTSSYVNCVSITISFCQQIHATVIYFPCQAHFSVRTFTNCTVSYSFLSSTYNFHLFHRLYNFVGFGLIAKRLWKETPL